MSTTRRVSTRRILGLTILLALTFPAGCASKPDQMVFSDPDSAVAASVAAIRGDDEARLKEIFGSEAENLIDSGDPVADREGRTRFLAHYDERNEIAMPDPDRAELCVGTEGWPFPIPLVKEDAGWRFDTEAGRATILARRIGRNELATIEVCQACMDAQLEYSAIDRDGDGILEYATRLRSVTGSRDGLYWPGDSGEAPSPMGGLVAAASARGYTLDSDEGGPQPFNGYLFKTLQAQGQHAEGGAYTYLAGDDMIGGFAGIAFPARYADSGVMTFIFSHSGKIYEKDLGPDSAELVAGIDAFDPDLSWTEVSTN